jgi:c-di-GMP-binding flagellar brake protein YcgR
LQFTKVDVSVKSIPTSPEVLMTDGADRREARRFSMSLPMRVLPREARSKELRANTRDVSYRGLYFLSETKFDVGHQIEFVLTLPEKISTSGAVDIRCIGKVVRVEAGKNGTMGVAAKIERYEFLPASATAT